MTYLPKPKIDFPGLSKNKLGLTLRDYEGVLSTLCAGCGHDSITAAIVQAFWELDTKPEEVIKISGIGCSSKTPAYFLSGSHGFNSVHGRMPSIATGSMAANRNFYCIGLSGDGDSLSIGMGQFAHVIRRNLNMLYIIENNGVYGLTKGQFSAAADPGSTNKKGEVNHLQAIDPVATAITLGGSFAARGFSGDKDQLVPLIKAGLKHRGCAILDVISPCVTFNNHSGSTKSYEHVREFYHPAIHTDFVPPTEEIRAAYNEGEAMPVELHDGSTLILKKTNEDYDPTSRSRSLHYLEKHRLEKQIVTGLLFVNEDLPTMHQAKGTVSEGLVKLDYKDLNPGTEALRKLQEKMR